MICRVEDCIDPATTNIIHHHHLEYDDKKFNADREDENHCVLTICQTQDWTNKETAIRHTQISYPRSASVAMYYCDYPEGRYHIL